MPSIGSSIREFTYGDFLVSDANGKCTTPNGMMAGTGVGLLDALKNVSQWAGLEFHQVLPMATSTPADAIGLSGEIGTVAPGLRANLIALDDSFGSLVSTRVLVSDLLDSDG